MKMPEVADIAQLPVNELLADRILPPDADRPRNKPAKPRTEMVKAAVA
ncbi:MAG TPA: hypothetical protein VF988_10525 [Verrucomicrobiae bacterium]